MNCTYQAEVSYNLTITHEEFEIIWRNATRHYSHDVKSETEQGIFNGMKNRMEWHKDDLKDKSPDTPLPVHPINYRKFQLIMKALEMDLCNEKTWDLMQALKKAFDEKQRQQELVNNYMEALEQQIF